MQFTISKTHFFKSCCVSPHHPPHPPTGPIPQTLSKHEKFYFSQNHDLFRKNLNRFSKFLCRTFRLDPKKSMICFFSARSHHKHKKWSKDRQNTPKCWKIAVFHLWTRRFISRSHLANALLLSKAYHNAPGVPPARNPARPGRAGARPEAPSKFKYLFFFFCSRSNNF